LPFTKWIGIFSWIEMGLSVVIGMALAAIPLWCLIVIRPKSHANQEPPKIG
jgi:NO-binding membrane sensor protein with MHYT domain